MTPVHITKRALAVVGGRDSHHEPMDTIACSGRRLAHLPHSLVVKLKLVAESSVRESASDVQRLTCPACLILLDAELEGRGAEAQRQRAEIEAGR